MQFLKWCGSWVAFWDIMHNLSISLMKWCDLTWPDWIDYVGSKIYYYFFFQWIDCFLEQTKSCRFLLVELLLMRFDQAFTRFLRWISFSTLHIVWVFLFCSRWEVTSTLQFFSFCREILDFVSQTYQKKRLRGKPDIVYF